MDFEDEYNDNDMSDFAVFAEDLIERYLRGDISFNQFVDAGTQPSTSAGRSTQEPDIGLETVTVGNEQNPVSEHSYVGPFKPSKSVQSKVINTTKLPRLDYDVLDEELLSNKTSELLAEIKQAYGRKKTGSSAAVSCDGDYNKAESEYESEGYVDDDRDEDYIPEGVKSKKSKTPRILTKKNTKSRDMAKRGSRLSKDLFSGSGDDKSPQRDSIIRSGRRKLPDELHSLLGQANVCFAQGRMEEAMRMCHEVVKQRPDNSEPYDVLATFYEQLGDTQKHLQFALLAAHLDYRCHAERWSHLAQLSLDHGTREQAIVCYTKAYRSEPTNWSYYDAKIKLLQKDLPKSSKKILETKQAAVRGMVDRKDQNLEDYLAFALPIFEESYSINDAQGAIICLKCCLKKAHAEGVVLYKELNHCLELLMFKKSYDSALNLVFSYTQLQAFAGKELIDIANEKKLRTITRFSVPDDFPVDIEAKTICCFIYLQHYESSKHLFSHFEKRSKTSSNVDLFLDIADALIENFQYEDAESVLVSIVNCPHLPTAGVWLCYAEVLSALGRLEAACKAYHNVVELAPQHINARLSLAALQQQLGLSEEAIQTLDIMDSETLLDLDERLLYQKCILLEQQNEMNSYWKCARQFLAMFFKEAHNSSTFSNIVTKDHGRLSVTLKTIFMELLKPTQLCRLVKKVPPADPHTAIKSDEIWGVFFKLCEKYYNDKRYHDMLHLCCYAYMCPALLSGSVGYVDQIIAMLLFSSLKTRSGKVMYPVLRYSNFPEDRNSYWNMMGLLFMFSQEVSYQRYILRQMLFRTDSVALSWFSGNNSLFSGIYHHALAEYVSILPKINDNPLINLLIGVCFISFSTKKDVNRRHDICIQGLCFLHKYEKLRGPCQETYYNMGRAMHQLGLTYAAVTYYEKVLAMEASVKTDEGIPCELFDLKRLAAHNLSLIYLNSNNKAVARMYLEKYCTV